jgi:hypothetical protein
MWTTAVWHPGLHTAFLFGGATHCDPPCQFHYLDDILAFRPDTGNVTVAGRLPTTLAHGASAYDGSCIYFFGGYGDRSYSQDILLFDAVTGRVARMPSALPQDHPVGMAHASAGNRTYLFGGSQPASTDGIILHYDGEESCTAPPPDTEAAPAEEDGGRSAPPSGSGDSTTAPFSSAGDQAAVDAATGQPDASCSPGARPFPCPASAGTTRPIPSKGASSAGAAAGMATMAAAYFAARRTAAKADARGSLAPGRKP